MATTEKTSLERFKGLAISFAVLCMVFIISTIGLISYYFPLANSQQTQINDLQSQAKQVNSQLDNSSFQLSNTSIQIASLQSQLSIANSINNLQESTVWLNNSEVTVIAGTFFSHTYAANYAGYVNVRIDALESNDYSLRASWSFDGSTYNNYDNTWSFGRREGTSFPVLPSSNILITLTCNNKPNLNLPAFITITYIY